MTKNAVYRIYIALCLFALVATGCLCLSFCRDVAYAIEPASLTVATEDGFGWRIKDEGGSVLKECDGGFYGGVAQEFAAFLKERYGDNYTLKFELPDVNAFFVGGICENPFTEADDSAIVVDGEFAQMIGGASVSLEYRREGEDGFEAFASTLPVGNKIVFGKGVAVGEYELRYVVTEEFEFANRRYAGRRVSSRLLKCSITASEPRVPSLDVVYAEYGTAAQDIGKAIGGGSWSFANDNTVAANTVLGVKDGGYMLRFDFRHDNPNYLPVKGVEVRVEILPKLLTVYVDDVERVSGEPLVSEFVYRVSGGLVGDDTAADLEIAVYSDCRDKNEPGIYRLYGRVGNPNYDAEFLSSAGTVSGYARYIVYPTEAEAVAEDGRKFDIVCGKGIKNLLISVGSEEAGSFPAPKNAKLLRAYRIAVSDTSYNPAAFAGGVSIGFYADGAGTAVCTVNGKTLVFELTNGYNVIDIEAFDTLSLAFYEKEDAGLLWYDILLLCVGGAFVAGSVAVVLAYRKKRWFV